MTATFRYIHHACFTVTAQGETLICDPFLDGNPTGVTQQDLSVDYIYHPRPRRSSGLRLRVGQTV